MSSGKWIAKFLIVLLPGVMIHNPVIASESGKKPKPAKAVDAPRPLPPPSDKTYRGFSSVSDWQDIKKECLTSVKGRYLTAYDAHLKQAAYLAPLKKSIKEQRDRLTQKQFAIDTMTAELKRNPLQAELGERLHDEQVVKEGMAEMITQREKALVEIEGEEVRLKNELRLTKEKIDKIFVIRLKKESPLLAESMITELRTECLRFPRVCDAKLSPEELITELFAGDTKESHCLEYLQMARSKK